MRALLLAWRLQRFELAFVAIVCIGLTAAAAWLTLDMRAILARCGTPDPASACGSMYMFQDTHAGNVGLVQLVAGLAPFAAGLVLGVPIVTREVEGRTALIAWPMARSRRRWLVWRTIPVALVTLGLVAALAIAADQMTRAYLPGIDIGFLEYHTRGLPLVMRSAVMLVAGVAIGALVGRLLPALLIGIGLSIAIWAGLTVALPHWAPSMELIEDEEMFAPGALATSVAYRLPDGRVVSFEEGSALTEAIHEDAGEGGPDPAELPRTIRYGIADARYPEVLIRETAALGAATAALGALAALAVHRRRPE